MAYGVSVSGRRWTADASTDAQGTPREVVVSKPSGEMWTSDVRDGQMVGEWTNGVATRRKLPREARRVAREALAKLNERVAEGRVTVDDGPRRDGFTQWLDDDMDKWGLAAYPERWGQS